LSGNDGHPLGKYLASDMFMAEGLEDKARRMYEDTDYAIVARNPLSPGFLDCGCQLMGMAEFMGDR
jgi:hypothetical protein